MHLILVALSQIAAVYGANGRAIAAAIDELLQARAAAGLVSRAYDPQQGLADLAVAAVDLTAQALVGQLKAIKVALAAQSAIIETLTIIGGPDVIPFGSLANPLNDGEPELRSDCVYGLADPVSLLADWPVGRLPDSVPPEAGLLEGFIRAASRLHQAEQRPTLNLGYSTERWREISAAVLGAAPGPQRLLVSPPALASRVEPGLLAAASLIYCNLHGVPGGPVWYGQARGDTQLIPALRPEDVQGLRCVGTVVVTQACFGARLAVSSRGRPLALGFLAGGARCFIGALGLTYGAIGLPLAESDLLVRSFFEELAISGASVGQAFQAAHARMLREALRLQGFIDNGDLKTLLEFVLYGDPTLPTWQSGVAYSEG